MNKTTIEGSIMEMLEPKVKEIQDKFSKGEKLGLQDFNLLLLKTQYNHINHLDQKLDEVVADVASLKSEFKLLETKMLSRLDVFESRLDAFEQKMEGKLIAMESKMKETIITNMKWTIGSLVFVITLLKIIEIVWH